ncbi:MAG TPA: hypothetical protein IAA67_08405 [Candidatus Avoscillospira stercorigallinarum]|uniref:Uncharacterized protein n=1 Tax=Candidatus Avoscillospira stercorigallinarum TaxID=2840708 RepID=A0A9D0Z9D8_9FIRM|nr:hypothetical protein [Candidatus Avoscillospira stercorigallinarum]
MEFNNWRICIFPKLQTYIILNTSIPIDNPEEVSLCQHIQHRISTPRRAVWDRPYPGPAAAAFRNYHRTTPGTREISLKYPGIQEYTGFRDGMTAS